ncbi:MAG: FprA family A-type flavoprotein [Bacteroidales bacterium]|nr:FprA family A-type flavoprotein [Bacteroidales bacterium]
MNQTEILPVADGVSWIGSLDKDLVNFDIVMETQNGTTYNSYFIDAGKKVVIDTVKKNFHEKFLGKIKELCDPADISYIVCNHTEPDHSGSLKYLLEIAPQATVIGSGQALNYLSEMIDKPFKSMKIKDGDTLDLGNRTLRFIGAANLHWPDTIYTYLEEDRVLFTCDSFGAHFCDEKMFDDLVGDYSDEFKYYFDVILKPFSKFMLKAIKKIELLDISMICPGHGPILRSTWKEKVQLSREYSEQYFSSQEGRQEKILITYVSAYGYTSEMAKTIADGIRIAGDIRVEVLDIENIQLGDLEENIVRSGGILIGSPTINRNTLLPVYKLFSVINPIRDKGKLAASFGSYGWSGEAITLIEEHLKNLKLEVVQDGLAIKFFPSEEQTNELLEFGKTFGLKFLENQAVK